MKVNVKQGLKTDVASALKLCTDQKSQEAVYAKLPGSNLKIKREGKAPNVRLRVSRTMPANPPAAIKRLVPATNEVSHTEAWRADGNGHVADIAVDRLHVRERHGNKGAPTREGRLQRRVDLRRDERSAAHRQCHRVVRGSRTREEPGGRVQGPQGHGLKSLACSAFRRNALHAGETR